MKTTIAIYLILILTCLTFNCVQETQLKTITFSIDMRNETNVSNVGIRGNISPLSWEESTVMTDDTKDGIYTTTVQFKTANAGLEFKFVANDEAFELVDQDNRQLRFGYVPETIYYRAVFDSAESSFSSK